jgi:predicted O-linked N-acetylglucosamine transferase (SPINDLY family)
MPGEDQLDAAQATRLVMAADTFSRAVACLQQGRSADAGELCTDLLRRHPSHAGALHVLGIIAAATGRPAAAVDFFRRSLASDPGQPMTEVNLGNALREVGDPTEALASYRRALERAPDFAGALYGEGNALLDLARPVEAVGSFDLAVRAQPDHADAYNNRGNALFEMERLEAALDSYLRALAVRPQFELALDNCARTLMKLRRFDEALRCHDRRLVLQPGNTRANIERGQCLLLLERAEEAWSSFSLALSAAPGDVDALFGRGLAARALKRPREALIDFDRASALRPQSLDLLYRKAEALRDCGRLADAAACFAHVLEAAPEYEYALGNLMHARLQMCDWTDYAINVERATREVAAGKRVYLPGAFLSVARAASEQLACARSFWKTPPAAVGARQSRIMFSHERIRVAYLSADFREHPVATLLVGVLERHDRRRFEIFGISFAAAQDSPIGRRIHDAFDHFVDVSRLSDAAVAAHLEELEIDIAVDLMGFSEHGRPLIFARRPAPAQVGYLGYPGSLGTAFMDYVIADTTVIPPGAEENYTESVVYLPHSYLPSDDQRTIALHSPTRAACGLPNDGFVFCCFNSHYKISPEVFDAWMQLLRAVPASVLWLAQGTTEVMSNLKREAAGRGVDGARLVFAPRLASSEEHLARYRIADLFLDTLPFNAHATASDALWAGLPVLTCRGATFAGRVAASLLTALGLPELIAGDLREYRAIALKLAAAPALLSELGVRLARGRHEPALFDTARYCAHLEAAFTTIRQRTQRREPHTPFTVESRA